MSENNSIRIDKGVPLSKKSAGRYAKYPFNQMDVGDSFFVAGVDNSTVMSSTISYWSKKLGRTYSVRLRDETGKRMTKNGIEGARVFRMA